MIVAIFIFLLSSIVGLLIRNNIKIIGYLVVIFVTFGYNFTVIFQEIFFQKLSNTQKAIFVNPIATIVLVAVLIRFFEIKILKKKKHTQKSQPIIKYLVFLTLISLTIVFKYKYIPASAPYYYLNAFAPLVIFLFLVTQDISEKITDKIYNLLINICTVIAVYGIIEFIMQYNIFYNALEYFYYSKAYHQFLSETPYRILSLTGHPLDLVLILILAVALLMFYKKKIKGFDFVKFIILSTALLLTFSRMAIIIYFTMIFVYAVVKGKSNKKVIFVLLLIIIPSILYLLWDDISNRFLLGASSTQTRMMGLLILQILNPEKIMLGNGFSSSRDIVMAYLNFSSSIEIPWIIQVLEYGIIATFLYITTILFILNYLFKKNKTVRLKYFYPAIFILMQISIFNGLMEPTFISIFLWFYLGLAMSNASLQKA